MAINSKQQSQPTTTRKFIPLDELPTGTGQSGRYVTNVTGILLGIEPRTGTYQIRDRRTGEVVTRPNSYTAVFASGELFSWPTYVDEDGCVRMWSRFEVGLELRDIISQSIQIHLWKDKKGFTHLELANQEVHQEVYQEMAPWD